MEKHTPAPWYVSSDRLENVFSVRSDVDRIDGVGKFVAPHVWGQANAAHIVRCVNAHEALVRALETLLGSLKWEEKRSGTTYAGYEHAKIALAKANGSPLPDESPNRKEP